MFVFPEAGNVYLISLLFRLTSTSIKSGKRPSSPQVSKDTLVDGNTERDEGE